MALPCRFVSKITNSKHQITNKGTLKVSNDEITVVFPDEEQKKSRLTLEGKRLHFWEIADVNKEFEQRKHELPEKLEKYKSYKPYSRPQRKVKSTP